MKLFNFFKKQKESEVKAEDEKLYSSSELEEWPSQPDSENKVPSKDALLKHGAKNAEYVKSLVEKCDSMVKEGDLLEYQVVMESQYGLFTIPAMIRREATGEFLAYYSYTDEWDEKAVQKLLNWVICIRGCDFIHTFKIVLCESTYDVPNKVKEILSKKTVNRMMISLIPHLRKDNPRINARVFSEAYGFYFNEKKLLNYDLKSLEVIESWYKKQAISCEKQSFYYPFYVHFIAAFVGQTICESFKVEWQRTSGINIVVIPAVKLKPRRNGMAPGDMKVNVFQICSDFVCNPRPENSPVTNFNMIKSEILKEA